MKIKIIVPYLIIFLTSCSQNQPKQNEISGNLNNLQRLEWLLSEWKNIAPDEEYYETWIKTNDTLFTGSGFIISSGDTVFSETIALRQDGVNIFYIPTVSGQNNAQPVSFKLIASDNGDFVFENKEHDFPQRIIYSNPEPDSLYARIEGNKNGKFHKEEFGMKKVK